VRSSKQTNKSALDISSVTRYYWLAMIKTFRDQETEQLFSRHFSRRFPPNLHRAAWKKLAILDAAEQLDDLRVPPGNRLEKLAGNHEGEYNIRINDQWRICFQWSEGNASRLRIITRR
jgi:proteic killer suppression protein